MRKPSKEYRHSPKATQKSIAEDLIAHVESVEHLRAELQKGINSLDRGQGQEVDIEQLIRTARLQYDGPVAPQLLYHRGPRATCSLYGTWGAEEWPPEQADRHLREIAEIFERLSDNPNLGRARHDLLRNFHSLVVRPHLIFYRRSSTTIDVVRVLHERLDTIMYFRHSA